VTHVCTSSLNESLTDGTVYHKRTSMLPQ